MIGLWLFYEINWKNYLLILVLWLFKESVRIIKSVANVHIQLAVNPLHAKYF